MEGEEEGEEESNGGRGEERKGNGGREKRRGGGRERVFEKSMLIEQRLTQISLPTTYTSESCKCL